MTTADSRQKSVILELTTASKQLLLRTATTDIETNLRGWQDQIGYVPQVIFLTDDSLRRNVAFGLLNEQIDEDAIWQAIRSAQLEEFVKDLPDGLDTLVGERGIRLSGGQRQRIGIGRAFYRQQDIFLGDEVVSSLDPVQAQMIIELIFKRHQTVVIALHNRQQALNNFNRIIGIKAGKIVFDSPAKELIKNKYQAGLLDSLYE